MVLRAAAAFYVTAGRITRVAEWNDVPAGGARLDDVDELAVLRRASSTRTCT